MIITNQSIKKNGRGTYAYIWIEYLKIFVPSVHVHISEYQRDLAFNN